MLDDPLPEELQTTDDETGAEDSAPDRSLTDDVSALIEDGQTYVEAELAYQKTRARFAASKGKSGLGMGVLALLFLHCALIGLVVGLLMILAPLITPVGATALVVVLMLVGVVVFGLLARNRFREISKVFDEEGR